MTKRRVLRAGSRASRLAQAQTASVISMLRGAGWPNCELVLIRSLGDERSDVPLTEIGGVGVFTSELESALRDHRIDFAVHSFKDLPIGGTDDLVIAAVPNRGDPRDVLVAREAVTLASLPPRATVGTSSTRRKAQVLSQRPDLDVRTLRGNVDTRIGKVMNGHYDAIILAAAGVTRLGQASVIREYLPTATFLPAPAQGALAVQCRREDHDTREALRSIDVPVIHQAAIAERAFLAELGGGCSLPVSALARGTVDGWMEMVGSVVAPDGRQAIRVEGATSLGWAERLGRSLGNLAKSRGALELIQ